MKVTQEYLKQVINEELQRMEEEGELNEIFAGLGALGAAAGGAIKRGATTVSDIYKKGEAEKAVKIAQANVVKLQADLQKAKAAQKQAEANLAKLSGAVTPQPVAPAVSPAVPATAAAPKTTAPKSKTRRDAQGNPIKAK